MVAAQTRISKTKTQKHASRNDDLVATAFIMLFLLESKKVWTFSQPFPRFAGRSAPAEQARFHEKLKI